MKVRIKKTHPNAVIPKYSKRGDGGMDLTAVEVELKDNYISYKTGLAFEIPEGYVGLLFPRSSVCNKSLILSNCVGVLDSGYRNEVEFRFKALQHPSLTSNVDIYNVGDRVGQIIIIPFPEIEFEEVENLSDSERGLMGFGSTGR